MYDLWYTLGAAIMDPKLLTSIQTITQATPAFNRLKGRVFVEVRADGSAKTISNFKTAGLMDPLVTEAVRDSIRASISKAAPGAPPVGYYTAGKLSQFLAIGVIDSTSSHGPLDFQKIIGLANGAFTAGPAVSPGFTALLGLCLIDEKARPVIAGSAPPKGDLLEAFSVTDAGEQARITAVVGKSDFQDAQKSFLEGDGNTWNPNEGSSEQFFRWEGHSERAVF